MRARITARRERYWGNGVTMTISSIDGRVTHWGRKTDEWLQWYAVIRDDDGTVLWRDDCRDLGKLIDMARPIAASFDCLQQLGQQFESWGEIVDRTYLD